MKTVEELLKEKGVTPETIRITNVQLTTSAPIAQNTCYRLAGFSAQKLNRSTNKKSFKK